MKKSLVMLVCFLPAVILFALLFHLDSPALAQGLPAPVMQDGPDPQPNEIEGIMAVLEKAWTAPYTELTNAMAWGDFDRDGDLDLFLGNSGANRLYENQAGTLVEYNFNFNCAASNENTSSVAWSDMNRDGYLEISIGNFDGKSCVYRYNPSLGTFQSFWQADYDQNTRSIAATGWAAGSPPQFHAFLAIGNVDEPNAIYRYEAGNLDLWWSDSINSSTNSLAWGDYNEDGLPDLAVGNSGAANLIYRNNGDGFSVGYTTPEQYHTWSVAWGDMNGDGYLDLAVGNGSTTGVTYPNQVYCNTGFPTYTFNLCWTSHNDWPDLAPTRNVSWGDFDGDGDLDLAASSDTSGNTRVYFNNGGMLDTQAYWNANDESSESRAVAWADWDGDGDMELAIGYRNAPSVVYQNTFGGLRARNFGTGGYDSRGMAWGDYDGDGDMDLMVANASSTANHLYRNNGSTLELAWTTPHALTSSSVAWGDVDGDGDLDLLVGNGATSAALANQIYINHTGDGGEPSFSLYPFVDGFNATTYSVAWGDFDGDQDLDFVAGNYPGYPSRIYINNNGIFTRTINLGNAADATMSVAWGDFDQDYDLDLAIGNNGGVSRVYINNGNNSFTGITLPPPDPVSNCPMTTNSIAWADWDGDGDLDLALGNSGQYGCVYIVEANKVSGNWTFNRVWQSDQANMDVRSLAWGDYDGDGRPDLGLGVTGQYGQRNTIYRNMGGSMAQTWIASSAEIDLTRAVAWADWDGDGDLDLAAINSSTPAKPNRLYVNTRNGSTNLANDSTYVRILRPDATGNAWFFSTQEIYGNHTLYLEFQLFDDEYDHPVMIEPQVSWDGGGKWETAWEAVDWYSDGIYHLSASPDGVTHTFAWDVLHQLLDHQGIPFDPKAGVYAPFDKSFEEMDVAFRIKVWDIPQHGGLIQRPAFGSTSTLFRVDMRPDWSDSAKLAPQYAVPGERLEFTIAIKQTDHGMPESFILDTLPQEFTLTRSPEINLDTGELGWASHQITWTSHIITPTGAIPFDEQLLITFDPLVERPLPDGLLLENCALIFDGLHQPFDRCVTVEISSTPQLDDSWKLVDGELSNVVIPGDIMTYTITLTNTGTDNARTTWMTDSLPAEVTFAGLLQSSQDPPPTYNDGMISWNGEVKVFEPVVFTYTVEVNKPLPGTTNFMNTFWVSDGINPPIVSAPVWTTVLAPDLRTSTKVAGAESVELGDQLSYQITLINSGSLDAGLGGDLVTLTDQIPEGSQFVQGSLSASAGQWGYIAATRTVTWTGEVSMEEPVEINFDIIVGVPLPAPHTVLTNVAELYEPLGGPVTLVEETDVWLPDMSPSYKTATPDMVELGDIITYTLVISNVGGRAPDISLVDPLPVKSQYVEGSLQFTSGSAAYVPGSKSITWTGTVESGELTTVTFAVIAGAPINPPHTTLTNVATLTDPMGGQFNLTAHTTIRLPILTTSSKSATQAEIEQGEVISYTLLVKNTGGYEPNLTLTDPIPPGSQFKPGSYLSSDGMGGYQAGSNAITWNGEMLEGDVITITFAITGFLPLNPPTLEVINVATLVDSAGRSFPLTAKTKVKMSDFSTSTKTATPAQVEMGDQINYSIFVKNTGGYEPALEISDPVPGGTQFVAGSFQSSDGGGGYQAGSNAVTWLDDLVTDQSVTLDYSVIVGCPVNLKRPEIVNTLYMTNSIGSLTTLVATTPVALPDLSLSTASASPSYATPGSVIKYTVVVRNSGGNAPSAYLLNTLPDELLWNNVSSASSGTLIYLPATRQVRWDGSLAMGDTVTLTFQLKVKFGVTGGQIQNSFILSDGCADTILGPVITKLNAYVYLPITLKK